MAMNALIPITITARRMPSTAPPPKSDKTVERNETKKIVTKI